MWLQCCSVIAICCQLCKMSIYLRWLVNWLLIIDLRAGLFGTEPLRHRTTRPISAWSKNCQLVNKPRPRSELLANGRRLGVSRPAAAAAGSVASYVHVYNIHLNPYNLQSPFGINILVNMGLVFLQLTSKIIAQRGHGQRVIGLSRCLSLLFNNRLLFNKRWQTSRGELIKEQWQHVKLCAFCN